MVRTVVIFDAWRTALAEMDGVDSSSGVANLHPFRLHYLCTLKTTPLLCLPPADAVP